MFGRLYTKQIHGSYDIVGSGYKFIHYDLMDEGAFLIVTLIIRATFVTMFSPYLNVGSFIRVQNFGVTFQNKFLKGDWSFVLKVGTSTMIEHIGPFMFDFCFVTTHSHQSFIQRQNLQELGTSELVVIKIYGRFSKIIILIIVDDLGLNDTQALFFSSRVLSTICIVETYSTRRPTTFLANNVGNFMSSEQLLTKFSTIC